VILGVEEKKGTAGSTLRQRSMTGVTEMTGATEEGNIRTIRAEAEIKIE